MWHDTAPQSSFGCVWRLHGNTALPKHETDNLIIMTYLMKSLTNFQAQKRHTLEVHKQPLTSAPKTHFMPPSFFLPVYDCTQITLLYRQPLLYKAHILKRALITWYVMLEIMKNLAYPLFRWYDCRLLIRILNRMVIFVLFVCLQSETPCQINAMQQSMKWMMLYAVVLLVLSYLIFGLMDRTLVYKNTPK